MTVALVSSYCILNIYNLCLGGKWLDILNYVYPILSDEYLIDNLTLPIQPGLNISLLMMLAFLAACCMAARKFFMGQMEANTAFMCMISANGMGVFLYFMNRAAYGDIFIGVYQVVLLTAVTADLLKRTDASKKEYFVRYVGKCSYCLLFGVISMLAVDGLFYTGVKLNIKKDTSWKMEDVETWKEQISSIVPRDTPALGAGVNALYGFLGWDTKYHITDFSDWVRIPHEYVIGEISELDAFFANEESININNFEGMECFNKTTVINSYVYYTRKERPEYTLGSKMMFCGDGYNADMYVLKGISQREEGFSWTENNMLKMWMSIKDAPEMMHMTVELADVYNSEQNVSTVINGTETYNATVVSGNNIEFDFASNGAEDFNIEFNLPNAVSPASLGASGDARNLALAIVSIVIDGK